MLHELGEDSPSKVHPPFCPRSRAPRTTIKKEPLEFKSKNRRTPSICLILCGFLPVEKSTAGHHWQKYFTANDHTSSDAGNGQRREPSDLAVDDVAQVRL